MFRRRHIIPLLLAFAAWSVPALPGHACLNDRDSDSLAAEAAHFFPPPADTAPDAPEALRQASGLPNLVYILTGRFERNPPLYYEMRVQRLIPLLKNPESEALALYDDIAVALDRLGRDDEGLAWLAKKRKILDTRPLPDAFYKEAWYRYYANIGTLRIHRWLRAGARPERIAEARQARAEIAKAIAIKPNAHFNREKYQLKAMDWILALKDPNAAKATDLSFARYLRENTSSQDTERAIEGLSGLVVLGNAWESADVFGALDEFLTFGRHEGGQKTKLGYLAHLRCAELIRSGHKSLLPADLLAGKSESGSTLRDGEASPEERIASVLGVSWHRATNLPNVRAKFHELRAAADAYQKNRADYMTARLKAGRHPDADPTFWADYRETPPPSLEIPFWDEARDNFFNKLPMAFMLLLEVAIAFAFVGLPVFFVARALRNFLRVRSGRVG